MTVNFKELLSVPVDSVKAPEALPEGHYTGRLRQYEFLESSKKKTPFVRFTITLDSANEDVDAAALADVDLSKKQLRADYYLTPDSLFRLKNLLESLKINIAGRSFDEALPETQNMIVVVEVTRRPNDDGSAFFNDVKDIAGA